MYSTPLSESSDGVGQHLFTVLYDHRAKTSSGIPLESLRQILHKLAFDSPTPDS